MAKRFNVTGNCFPEANFAKTFTRLLAIDARHSAPTLVEWLKKTSLEVQNFNDLSDWITDLTELTAKKIVLLIDEVDQSSNNEIFIKFLALLRNKHLSRSYVNELFGISTIRRGLFIDF
jgi:hypothetical protein